MKIAYLDLFCGISGDMTLGAVIDAGLPVAELKRGLAKFPLKGYSLGSRKVMKGSLAATKADVTLPKSASHGHGHTPLKKILGLLKASRLPAPVTQAAEDVFLRLGRAEGRIHRMDPMKVEFHEVGAVDSIVDIVGSCLGFHLLGIEQVYCSKVPTTGGTLQSRHGIIPNPGPATLELLKGFPLTPVDLEQELVTPTGAALLSSWVREPGRFPEMTLDATGYGAGDRDLEGRANILRLLLGTPVSPETSDTVVLVETNLDNVSGELVGYLFEKLLSAGAVDVYTTAIQMKK